MIQCDYRTDFLVERNYHELLNDPHGDHSSEI